MPDRVSDDGPPAVGDEVRQFIALCRKRYHANNTLSATLVVLGYISLVSATMIGILRDNGGRLAACGTFLTVVIIASEQSFGFSEAADVQGVILAEAEVLLSELVADRKMKAAAAYVRLNDLRLRLARVSRRSRIDPLRHLLEQGRPRHRPRSATGVDDDPQSGEVQR